MVDRAYDDRVLVSRLVFEEGTTPGCAPCWVESRVFRSEAEAEKAFKNLFHVEVTQ